MTFTIAARRKRTGKTASATATVSLAVGRLCPWFKSSADVISSQAYASKPNAKQEGKSTPVALAGPKARDFAVASRQSLIRFTGKKCRPCAGHRIGEGVITAGNVLAGGQVIAATATATGK